HRRQRPVDTVTSTHRDLRSHRSTPTPSTATDSPTAASWPAAAAAPDPSEDTMTIIQTSRPDTTGSHRNRPLRVLQVVHRFLPELGGTETHVAQVTQRLAQRSDVEVTILTTDRSGKLPPRELINGVPVIRSRAWPVERDYYFSPQMRNIITYGQWDVIHFQGTHTLVPVLGMLAARRAGIPYVLTFHSGGHSSAARTSARGPQFRALAGLLADSERLIAVSRFERNRFSELTGIPRDHFVVIGNGGALPAVAADEVAIPGRIVSSGRLEHYKGHHRAIEALPEIRRQIPGASLLVLGSGPYEAELNALAARLGISDAVEITHLPPAERGAMATELARSSVMAALSSYEAHPVGVMEAVASGLPVLGFDVAGIGDLVEDGLVTGISPASTTSEIATALVGMLRVAATAGPRTRPDIALPTWEDCADGIAAVYHQVVHERIR
ncbi:MAG: glycosyltransferase family 4 protein, partial [Nakamurella sp.]